MKYVYHANVVEVTTDNKGMKVIFEVPKKDFDKFMESSHVTNKEVHVFTVKNLRVFIQNVKGTIVLNLKEK